MTPLPAASAERLFPHFLDAIDGTLCLPARATAEDLHALVAPHPLRFPLLLDSSSPLRDQVAATTHAPASSRFGPFCDNILGMNWRLPSGQSVRIGERVAKTTTGYDWLRFLLHTGPRFGEPLDFVLRLRPDCAFTALARFDGPPPHLHHALSQLLHSAWLPWWDAVDYLCEDASPFLRVTVHTPPSEADLFADQLTAIASATHTALTWSPHALPPAPGLPDLVLKTTPNRLISLAHDLAPHAARAEALCYHGVLHLFGDHLQNPDHIRRILQPHLIPLHAIGGGWHSRHLLAEPPAPGEAAWIATLERALHDH